MRYALSLLLLTLSALACTPPPRPTRPGPPAIEPAEEEPPTVGAGLARLSVPVQLRWAYGAAADSVPGLEPDARLAQAATAVLRLVGQRGSVPPREEWMDLVLAAGIAEPVPALLVVSAPTGDTADLEAALRGRLEARVRGLGCNRVGLAVGRSGPVDTLVAVVVASHLTMDPVPVAVGRGQAIRLRGEAVLGVESVEVLVAEPGPRVESIVESQGREFDATYRSRRDGTYRFEVIGTAAGSPTVLANFTVVVGDVGPSPRPVPPGATTDPVAAQERLFQLLNETRRQAGLGAVAEHPALDEAASAYALDMATRGFFGHMDPEGRGPGARVSAAGLRAPLVLENLSRAPTAEEAHAGLMESPAHLRAMLEPVATHAGVGVHGDDELGLWVVELLARVVPTVSADEGARIVLAAIEGARRARRARDLEVDERLVAAAGTAADLLVAGSAGAEEALEEARRALATAPPRALRAVVARTADLVDAAGLEPALAPDLARVGVAVREASDDSGGYHVVVLLAR